MAIPANYKTKVENVQAMVFTIQDWREVLQFIGNKELNVSMTQTIDGDGNTVREGSIALYNKLTIFEGNVLVKKTDGSFLKYKDIAAFQEVYEPA